ncbi:MAG TPA: Hsp20/alpha crystallin family protein [Candidatus Eremiobacteraceae bacterium]|nr:Hsp20/alpha crystallin family protein [Candidatus Eremiobacteraceae bacterium]
MSTTLTPKRDEIRPFFEDFYSISPFGDFGTFRRAMNSFLDTSRFADQFIMPAIDLYNKDGKYNVEVALPGLDKKDIEIQVEGNSLTISGKYATEQVEKEKKYQYREMRRGSFSRSVSLPEDIDADKVTAEFDKGILKIQIPSLKPAQPTKVTIS